MIHYLKKIASWLLPFHCLLCGNPSTRQQDLCTACYQTLPFVEKGCLRCATPLTADAICGQCLNAKKLPFQKIHALFLYEWPIANLILKLKFQQSLNIARLLGELLAEKIKSDWYPENLFPDVIIPIPLHPKRLQERGFNQSIEIAKPITSLLNRPLLTDVSLRIKPTLAQATLPKKMRQQNMKNAFKIKGSFKNLQVAVIDDVITTGSTIFEFCTELKNQGASRIDVWCVGRARKYLIS